MEKNNRGVVQGRHYQTGVPIRISMVNGLIERVEPFDPKPNQPLHWIGPGLVDLQINGFAGIDFNTEPIRAEDVQRVTRLLWLEGVTTYYPTVVTNGDEPIERMVRAIALARAADRSTAETIAGIHLEGPFLSPLDGPRGAHASAFIKAPDWELFQRWQQAADGLITMVTLSPEYEEAPAFIERCVRSGVVVSIGHTAADSGQIRRAVEAGATMSTHLGNGAHPMLPRHPNYIWDQLAEDSLTVCMIADGYHLPDAVLKVFLKAKGERLMLVSDAVYLAGMPPGEYVTHIGGKVVLTEEGRLYLADHPQLLAGSVRMLLPGIEHLVESGICPLSVGWDLASRKPASFMKLKVGAGLAEGVPADLILLQHESNRLVLRGVYKGGRLVAQANTGASSSQA